MWPFRIEEENRVEGDIFRILFDWIRKKKRLEGYGRWVLLMETSARASASHA